MDPLILAGAALVAAAIKHKRDADAYAKRRAEEQRDETAAPVKKDYRLH